FFHVSFFLIFVYLSIFDSFSTLRSSDLNIYFIEDVVFIFSWFLIFKYSDKIIDVRIVYFIVFTNRQCITHTPFFHKSKFFATNIKKNIIMEILFSILLHHLIAIPFYIYS